MTQISTTDIVIIALYIIFIIFWALKNRQNSDASSYFLAGKSQSWWMIGLSLFAASVSTSTLIGHSGEGFISGVAVFNYNVGAVFVIIFVALFFLPFYIRSGIYTIPEFLGKRFDNRSRRYFSLITLIGNIFLDAAASLYTGALILKMLFPSVDMLWVIAGMGTIAGIYSIIGGLSSAINADMIQSVVLIVGSALLSWFCFDAIGGWDQFLDTFHDGVWLNLIRPATDTTVPWFAIWVSIPIVGFYFWGNNQVMVQRVLSAKSVNEGRLGLLLVAFIYLFTLVIFITPGMVARGIDLFGIGRDTLPNQIIDGLTLKANYGIDTNEVYPRLILKMLPVGLIGVMIATMISALTSTLSATLNSVSTLFTMDFYRLWKPKASGRELVRVGQITSVITLVVAILWAPLIGKFASLVAYYQEFMAYLAPPVVCVFIVGLFSRRANARGAFAGLMGGFMMAAAIMLLKFGFGVCFSFHFLLWVPILFVATLIITMGVSYASERPDADKTDEFTWNTDLWKNETSELRGVAWYKNFRVLSAILIVLALCEYIFF